jgi:hypothetical protein
MFHDRVYLRLLGGGVGMAHVPPVTPSSCINLVHPLLVLGIVVVELVAASQRGGIGGGGRAREGLPVLFMSR